MPRRSSPPVQGATLGGAPFLAPTQPNGPPRGKNVEAGLVPRAFSGGRNAAPPKATALAIGCPRKRLRKCPTAVCAIWQTVKADARVRPPFSVGKAAGRGPFVDPSHGFRFPSHGSADPSHGNFVPWALFDRKMALIFAIATVDAVENNRFSVLKKWRRAAFGWPARRWCGPGAGRRWGVRRAAGCGLEAG